MISPLLEWCLRYIVKTIVAPVEVEQDADQLLVPGLKHGRLRRGHDSSTCALSQSW